MGDEHICYTDVGYMRIFLILITSVTRSLLAPQVSFAPVGYTFRVFNRETFIISLQQGYDCPEANLLFFNDLVDLAVTQLYRVKPSHPDQQPLHPSLSMHEIGSVRRGIEASVF